MSILDLSEFSFILYDLILILTLIRCRSMASRKREACIHPLFHNTIILLGRRALVLVFKSPVV
jgi:hypothetical protein